jgi:hypothetical protein
MKDTDDLALISVSFNFRDEPLFFLDNKINFIIAFMFKLLALINLKKIFQKIYRAKKDQGTQVSRP